jgi:hypothetical protein
MVVFGIKQIDLHVKCIKDNVLIGMAGHNLDFDTYTDENWSLFYDQQFGYTPISPN